jgi:AMP-polyphosphate phosphotransferase
MRKSLTVVLREMAKVKKVEYDKASVDEEIKKLQLKMLRIHQGIFHKQDRVVIIFEGFDAAGKGGAIRALTEKLDPRNVHVIPIGAPTSEEKGKHWLYRFWRDLPAPGHMTIFDRSWYGRVLIEKVDKLATPERLRDAHREINEFEAQLVNDGITVIKFFLAITKSEQLERFEDRLNDPYKQWKITDADVEARKNWTKYVKAVDEILVKNNHTSIPWHLIPANSKRKTRKAVLSIVTTKLKMCEQWIEKAAQKYERSKLLKRLR